MSLSPADRVILADQAYLRAVAFARARSTPASWTRLLRAARNRAAALCEEKALQARPGTHGRTARASRVREVHDAPPSPRPVSPAHASRLLRSALASECERARALMEWSRALIEEARALQSVLVGFAALGSRPLPAWRSGW